MFPEFARFISPQVLPILKRVAEEILILEPGTSRVLSSQQPEAPTIRGRANRGTWLGNVAHDIDYDFLGSTFPRWKFSQPGLEAGAKAFGFRVTDGGHRPPINA